MLKNQSLDNKEKCEFNMISHFSYWTNIIHTSPVMKLMHWQYCFMKLWIHFLLTWAFQTQLRNSNLPFQLFHRRKAKGGIGEGGLQILQLLLLMDCTGAEPKRIREASSACLGWMVLVELCKLGVSLTQTAKLERHPITVQFKREWKAKLYLLAMLN